MSEEERISRLSETVNTEIYEQRKHLLGKVLTIVDSAIADPTQRKAIKDLVNGAFYEDSYWNILRQHFGWFAESFGIKNLSSSVYELGLPGEATPANPYITK